MLSFKECFDIAQEVRRRFKPGGKSNNKLYAPEGVTEAVVLGTKFFEEQHDYRNPAKAERRLTGKVRSDGHRVDFETVEDAFRQDPKGYGMHVGYADAYLALEENQSLAGNCMEMAIVAAGLVARKNSGVRIYYCGISGNADHAFCLISDHRIDVAAAPATIEAMCRIGFRASRTWRIIDPWLNVWCNAGLYQHFANKKLDEWTGKRKRIAWKGSDGSHPGWYPPSGSYASALMTEPLSFQTFNPSEPPVN